MLRRFRHLLFLLCVLCAGVRAAGADEAIIADQSAARSTRNTPAALEWLQNAGFGLFIHWSVDSQLGGDISHVIANADKKVLDWYFSELPKGFNPARFDPDHYMTLAKLAGMQYVVFTAKHHNGFCWWDTATTEFNIMKTPYGKDVVKAYCDAARRAGLKVGIYYSPEDFLFLHQHGLPATRPVPPMDAATKVAYEKLIRAQTRELMTKYGKIDVLFIDGSPSKPCKNEAWDCNPEVLVTRGALVTPEQRLPGVAPKGPWESCVTMGTQWSYRPNGEVYKSSSRLVELLFETRAKGGSLLLNVGPSPSGELPVEQEGRLRDIALWHAFNNESIHDTRPWIITNEEGVWFTRQKDSTINDATVYAAITAYGNWPRGQRRTVSIHSVKATDRTKVTFLGQDEKTLEYKPDVDPSTTWIQTDTSLDVSAMRSLRFVTAGDLGLPMVLKLEHVQPALVPPAVVTTSGAMTGDGSAVLHAKLMDLGDAAEVQVGFEYQEYLGFTEVLYNQLWTRSALIKRTSPGDYAINIEGLAPGKDYHFRAVVVHPRTSIKGDFQSIESRK